MLGDVARWLRILGEDCLYALSTWSDDEVASRAMEEGRIVVTRDAHLAARSGRVGAGAIHVKETDVEDALVKVYAEAGLRPDEDRLATRCATCNGLLVATDAAGATQRAVARGRTPPEERVTERHTRFWSCSRCGQAYWRGTHWDTIEATRKRVFARVA